MQHKKTKLIMPRRLSWSEVLHNEFRSSQKLLGTIVSIMYNFVEVEVDNAIRCKFYHFGIDTYTYNGILKFSI